MEAGPITARDQARLQSALAAYNEGQTREAESTLQDLAQRYPGQFEVVETLGLIYAERGEVERALLYLESGCRANAASAEAAANLGVAYLKLNRAEKAEAALGRAVSLAPGKSETQSSYGHASMMAKHPQRAAKAFAAASAGDPNNPDILYNWALAEFESGEAQKTGEILARIPPTSRSAQMEVLWGDGEEKQGHFDRALARFQEAVQMEGSETNLDALGLELLKHWSFEAARRTYEYGVAKYPESSRLQTGLGIALYGDARYGEAAQVFSRLLTAAPEQASYAKLLGQACVAMKEDSHESCNLLIRFALQHPGNAAAGRLAAGTILTQHDAARWGEARQLLQRAIGEEPSSAEGYYRLGVLDQEEGKWSDSVTVLKRADALRPGSSKTHLRLAVAYAHLERKQQAHEEADLQRQLRLSEDAEMERQRKALTTFMLEMR